MKKFFLTLIVGVCITSVSFAQVNGPDYKAGIGLRFSGSYYDAISASFKLFVSEPSAFEFNAGARHFSYGRTNVSASAAYQYHFPIGSIEGFKWFVGGGLTVLNSFADNDRYEEGFGFALFPTGGVEYKFNFPLAVSADFRPSLYLVNPYDEDFNPNFGVSARFTFK
ncbi:hypothetical protein [Flavitalea sp.]|nr:hypothetical protein [Flavitalea sp.]